MNETDKTPNGALYALMATLLWGSYPLWYYPLKGVSSLDVLGVRVIGSLFFVCIFLVLAKNASFSNVKSLLMDNKARFVLGCSAAVSAVWWLTYIYGVTHELVLEASLGYYISPIFSILFGFLVFRERPSYVQWVCIALTTFAIVNLVHGYGEVPWVAIIIGFCFSLYAAIRKGTSIKPLPGLAVECVFLFPFAVVYFIYMGAINNTPLSEVSAGSQWFVLIAVGLISVLPLWWYTIAAQSLKMIALSFFQFVPPTCNFIFAVFVFGEPFTGHHMLTFGLITLAVTIYILDKSGILNRNTKAIEGL